MPPRNLWGSRVEERAEWCEWQGGTVRVTAESKQPRWTRGHPEGSDPASPALWTGALLLADDPVTRWQEPKFPTDFGEDSCPVGLDQPRWEWRGLNSCLI